MKRLFSRRDPGRIQRLAAGLRDTDEDRRTAAMEELTQLDEDQLSEPECVELLELSLAEFPPAPAEYSWADVPDALVNAALQRPSTAQIPIVQRAYAGYSDKVRASALCLLARLGSRPALECFVALLREHGAPDRPPPFAAPILTDAPEHGDIVFPALLEIAGADDDLLAVALEVAIAYEHAGELTEAGRNGCRETISAAWPRLRTELGRADSSSTAGLWAEEYESTRLLAGLCIDLAGLLGGHGGEQMVTDALAARDPRLRMFGILSALRTGRPVDAEAVIAAAAQPEVRYWLFVSLDEMGRLDLLPDEYTTQEALAEAEMANWLVFPTELGREPDELELMGTFGVKRGWTEAEVCLFRYRTLGDHWSAGDGWQAGIAGPYERGQPASLPGGGATFSRFESWYSATPKEHVETILGVVGGWRLQPRR